MGAYYLRFRLGLRCAIRSNRASPGNLSYTTASPPPREHRAFFCSSGLRRGKSRCGKHGPAAPGPEVVSPIQLREVVRRLIVVHSFRIAVRPMLKAAQLKWPLLPQVPARTCWFLLPANCRAEDLSYNDAQCTAAPKLLFGGVVVCTDPQNAPQ
jgi:hypothetical protein